MGFFKLNLLEPKILLIDFHGTIAPTAKPISQAFASAIIAMHSNANRKKLVEYYINSFGTPLEDQARQGLKIADGKEHSKSEGNELSDRIWKEVVKLKIVPFKEIPSELKRLKKAGWKIFLSTDNPQWVAEKLVDTVGLQNCFDGVLARNPASKEHKVIEHIRQLAQRFGIPQSKIGKHFVYLGDSKSEMENARKIGITGIGRTTSYSARAMKKAGAKFIIPGKGLQAKLHLRFYLGK